MREIEFKAYLGDDQIKKLRQGKTSAGLVTGVLAVALVWIFSAISLGPAQLEFGSLPVGSDSRLPVKLTNRGLTEFHATSIEVAGDSLDFRMNEQQCVTVAPGESCVVWVEFRPRGPGVKLARLTVRTKDGGELSSSFTGSATPGNTPDPQPVTPIASIVPAPPPAPSPRPANPAPPNVIQPRSHAPSPPPADPAPANLIEPRLPSPPLPPPPSPPLVVSPPPIYVPSPPIYAPPYHTAGGRTLEPAPTPAPRPKPLPQIQIQPRELDFSQHPGGGRQVIVSNPGNGPLDLRFTLAGADSGSFAYDRRACGNVLAPSSQCVVTVIYSPGATPYGRALNAWFAVNHNASGTANPQLVALSWRPSIPLGHPHVTITPNPVRFTAPSLGAAVFARFTQTVTVTSDGTAGLRQLRVQLSSGGIDRGPFSQTSRCPTTLNTGQSCTVQVGFSPGGAQQYNDQLNVFEGATQMASAALQASGSSQQPPPKNPGNAINRNNNWVAPGNTGYRTRPSGNGQLGDLSNGNSGQTNGPAPGNSPKSVPGWPAAPTTNSGTNKTYSAPTPIAPTQIVPGRIPQRRAKIPPPPPQVN